jgi:hydrogenase-4 component F
MTLIALLLIPFAAAGIIWLMPRRTGVELVHAIATVGTFCVGMAVAAAVWSAGPLTNLNGLLRSDALSAFMVALITFVSAIAGVYAVGYMRAEETQPARASSTTGSAAGEPLRQVRLFFALYQVLILMMLLAVTTDNVGIMWVAVEGTTLATVFLVNLHGTRSSLEAAYKYLIVSSVGLAMAFLGTALMYYAGAPGAGEIAVNWTALRDAASSLNPQVVRLAFVFVLIGYGTKAGLAPMHTWLPDAHSEAPAPISALMSGVLLNIGLYAVMRFKTVTDLAVGEAFSSRLLVGMGLLSLAVAAVFLLTQANYKRMLAYSSVEHIGMVCLGLGFGGYWGVLGALLQLANHALAKSMMFLLSGNIYLKYRSTAIADVGGLLRAAPWTGRLFLLGTLALVGLPPFGLFVSEFVVFRAGLENNGWAAVAGILLLVAVFAGMLRSVNGMLYGAPPDELPPGDPLTWPLAPLAANCAMLLALGIAVPPVVVDVLSQVLRVLGVVV